MLRLLLATLGAIVAALFVVPPPAVAIPANPSLATYTHDGHYRSVLVDMAVERGPPGYGSSLATASDAVGTSSHGASSRPDGPTSPSIYDYDAQRLLVPVARVTTTTAEDTQSAFLDSARSEPAQVAANGGRTAARVCSFAGATTVLMADGSRKPIEDIKVGDKVIATDPETDEQVAKTVEHVFVHDDTVIDLVVDGEVTTTEDHPFWSVTDQRFERADELSRGEKVISADGRVITVSGLELGTAREALAYNLTVEGIHTYHVGDGEILVHNACPIPSKSNYRDLFKQAHPNMPDNYQVHHALPQKYAGTMERAGVNIHDPSMFRGVDPGIHSRITTAWGRWERGLGRTPTAHDITQFSYRIDEMYGSSFVW